MAFAQLTYRESLRDIETCLQSIGSKLYHMGFRSKGARSTLADANESRDWRIYADFAQVLIAIARPQHHQIAVWYAVGLFFVAGIMLGLVIRYEESRGAEHGEMAETAAVAGGAALTGEICPMGGSAAGLPVTSPKVKAIGK